MNCPGCGDINATALFTSVQCSTSNCRHYSQSQTTEIIMRNFSYQGTVTGRINCKEPNLSNLPRKQFQFSPFEFFSHYISKHQGNIAVSLPKDSV